MSIVAKPCSIESCEFIGITRRTWCHKHYWRWRKYGAPDYEVRSLVRHGLKNTHQAIYDIWVSMKARTLNPNCPDYKDYGGRGIKICDRWLHNFDNFYYDMGPRPTPQHSIDRKDNGGDYSPENCRWATPLEQSWNKGKVQRNTSGYIGVTWRKDDLKWQAQIGVERKLIVLGRFNDPIEAAITYDIAAIFFRGEYAITNIL